tara:strand:+ start:1016 stop:1741 length:726 start_codon:yes stop_codon:yes gene_type:complete
MTTTTEKKAPRAPKPSKSLVSKLAEVQASIRNVTKDGYNEFHKYKYAEEAAIVKACRWELAQRHIMVIPSIESVDRTGTLTTITTSFTLYDGESGETITSHWAGTGDDKGDKGLYKALTGSLKTYLTKLLLLPTGDDAEQESPVSVSPEFEDGCTAFVDRIVEAGQTGGREASAAAHKLGTKEERQWLLTDKPSLDRIIQANKTTPVTPLDHPPVTNPDLVALGEEMFGPKKRKKLVKRDV